MLFKDIADDVLARILEYLRDATSAINVATTGRVMMARLQKLVVTICYDEKERRVINFYNAAQASVYRMEQIPSAVRKLAINDIKMTKQYQNKVITVENPMSRRGNDPSPPRFGWTLPSTLIHLIVDIAVEFRTLPSLLVKLYASKCKLSMEFPKTLTELIILTAPHDEIRKSLLRYLTLRVGLLKYDSMPATLISCSATLEHDLLTTNQCDISRFEELIHDVPRGMSVRQILGAYAGVFKLYRDILYVESGVLPSIIQRIKLRPVIKLNDFRSGCVPPGLNSVMWDLEIRNNDVLLELPNNVTRLNLWQYYGEKLPLSLIKLNAVCYCSINELVSALEGTKIMHLTVAGNNLSFVDILRLRALKTLEIISFAKDLPLAIIPQLTSFRAIFANLTDAKNCAVQALQHKGVVTIVQFNSKTVLHNEDELQTYSWGNNNGYGWDIKFGNC